MLLRHERAVELRWTRGFSLIIFSCMPIEGLKNPTCACLYAQIFASYTVRVRVLHPQSPPSYKNIISFHDAECMPHTFTHDYAVRWRERAKTWREEFVRRGVSRRCREEEEKTKTVKSGVEEREREEGRKAYEVTAVD